VPHKNTIVQLATFYTEPIQSNSPLLAP